MIRRHCFSAVALGLLALSACSKPAPVKSLALLDGEITATTPAGYCVDTSTSDPASGFAVMAPCATLGAGDPAPDALGVATVQVGPPESSVVSGAESDLRKLLETDEGAALLSADGAADEINILYAQALENSVTVHFADDGDGPITGLQNQEWRAFTDINGRLVTVAVRGLATAPLQDGTGSWLLNLVVNGLLSTGGGAADDAPEA